MMNSYKVKFRLSDTEDGSILDSALLDIETVFYTIHKGKKAREEINNFFDDCFDNVVIISIKKRK